MKPARRWVVRCLTVATVMSLVGILGLEAQEASSQGPQERSPLLIAGHPALAASLNRIQKGSALWRSEAETLRHTGRLAYVVTTDQFWPADAPQSRSRASDPSVLAEIAIVPDGLSGIAAVVVVVNLPLLEAMHDRRGSVPIERYADLDRILIHEVYGHAFPYLRAGDESGRCADPAAGERPRDACAIRRENALRAELGLGRRTDYGLLSLTVGRPVPGPFGLSRLTP